MTDFYILYYMKYVHLHVKIGQRALCYNNK